MAHHTEQPLTAEQEAQIDRRIIQMMTAVVGAATMALREAEKRVDEAGRTAQPPLPSWFEIEASASRRRADA